MSRYKELMLEWEKRTLLNALALCNGNQQMASRMLGIHRNSLYRKLICCGVTSDELKLITGRKPKTDKFGK